jgi:hypothetical protein
MSDQVLFLGPFIGLGPPHYRIIEEIGSERIGVSPPLTNDTNPNCTRSPDSNAKLWRM